MRKYLQIDFDFYILWQWNKASFVQMCCCRCKVIFYNSIIHVSTFGFSKPPKKLGNKWKEQKKNFSFHATFMVNEFDLHWKKWAKTALKVRMTFNCSRTRSKLKWRKSDLWDHECPFRFAYEANISIIQILQTPWHLIKKFCIFMAILQLRSGT